MKNILTLSLILITTLAFGAACQTFTGSNWPATSEVADATPVTTVKTGKLTLNIEQGGTLEDPKTLNTKLERIYEMREGEGIFREGTNEISMDVYVVADPKISIGAIAKLTQTNGVFWFPRGKGILDPAKPTKPNPLMLVIKTENSPAEWFPAGILTDAELVKLACRVRFESFKERMEVVAERVTRNSIEIASDDSFFVNTKLGDDLLSADKLKPDQRAVTESELSSVLNKLYYKPSYRSVVDREQETLKVTASENASYASLLKLLAAIDSPGVAVTVWVRPLTFVEKKKDNANAL